MKMTLFVLILSVLSISLIGRVQPVSAQSETYDFQKVDAYITETMRRLPIKGMAVAIVKGDQTLYMQWKFLKLRYMDIEIAFWSSYTVLSFG